MSTNENVTQFLRDFLLSFLSPIINYLSPLLALQELGSSGGTNSGAAASPPSYPVFFLSMSVVNECRILLEIDLTIYHESYYFYYHCLSLTRIQFHSPQVTRSHHIPTLFRSRFTDSVTAAISPGDGITATKVE